MLQAQQHTSLESKVNTLKQMSLPKEQWVLVNGTDRYYVSNMGRLATLSWKSKSILNGQVKVFTPALDANGYYRTMILLDGKFKTIKMHRLVADHWVVNQFNKPQVNHNNHDRTDNRAENLEWVTHRENIDHMMTHGRQAMNNGTKNGMSKLNEDIVRQIRSDYKPHIVMAKDLAKKYEVSLTTIKSILRRKTWASVK